MKPSNVVHLGVGILLAVSAVSLTGCYGDPYHRPAPPPHAPTHGYRWHADDYFYYPNAGVYFHIHSGRYYYHDGGRWRHSTWLPPRVVILPRDRVRLKIKDRDPARHHHEHEQRYRDSRKARSSHEHAYERDRKEREYHRRQYREYRSDHR